MHELSTILLIFKFLIWFYTLDIIYKSTHHADKYPWTFQKMEQSNLFIKEMLQKKKKENKRNVTIILKNITQVYWKFKLSGAGLSFVQILVLCIGLPYASCNREEES